MCGICGGVNINPRAVNPSHIQSMVSMLRHRGSDEACVVSDNRIIFGHSRLSIIDLSGGSQPMSSHDGRFLVVFNGEIFNYLELRDQLLAMGHIFRTKSDTEVIIEAWRAWGNECFAKFNGQWAFALWDRKKQELMLSRDRAGIRPLYYCSIHGGLLFASEIKALFCHPDVGRRFDPAGLAQSYTFWCPVAPRTAFDGICQLPPGSYATVDVSSGNLAVSSYWALPFGADSNVRTSSLEDNTVRLREKLVHASRLRFDRSDVPVGAYLSGGIDSTITVAILAGYTRAPLKTFSVAFSDEEFDESGYQELVASRLGTEHQKIVVDAADIGACFPEVVWHGEQPILRTAPAPLFLLSRLVRDAGYKVVVTGEGSDEMLAGYDIFREARARRVVAENPDYENPEELLVKLYPWMKRSPARTPAFAKAFFSQDSDPDDAGFSHRPRWRTSASILQLISHDFMVPSGDKTADSLLRTLPGEFESWQPLEKAQYIEATTLLAGYILAPQGDRMLMGNSVEGRFPFLDHEVMEMAASLPPEQKLCGFDEKHILKKAFADIIPQEIIDRPKQPYRAPDAASFFFAGKSPDWMDSIAGEKALRDAGVFNPQMVSGLFSKAKNRKDPGMSNTDNMRIVAVISTMLLYHRHIRGTSIYRRAMEEGAHIPVIFLDREDAHAGS